MNKELTKIQKEINKLKSNEFDTGTQHKSWIVREIDLIGLKNSIQSLFSDKAKNANSIFQDKTDRIVELQAKNKEQEKEIKQLNSLYLKKRTFCFKCKELKKKIDEKEKLIKGLRKGVDTDQNTIQGLLSKIKEQEKETVYMTNTPVTIKVNNTQSSCIRINGIKTEGCE